MYFKGSQRRDSSLVMEDMATKPWQWPAFRIGLHQSSLGLSETDAQMITLDLYSWLGCLLSLRGLFIFRASLLTLSVWSRASNLLMSESSFYYSWRQDLWLYLMVSSWHLGVSVFFLMGFWDNCCWPWQFGPGQSWNLLLLASFFLNFWSRNNK